MDFAPNPIPPNFFCPGSPAFNGQIELQGKQLLPGRDFDTVVERLEEGSFGGGSSKIPVKVRALRLTSVNPITVACPGKPPNWRLDVCECGDQPTTEISVKVDQDCGCGHFDGSLEFKTCLRFTNDDNTVTPPVQQTVKLKIHNMPWCPKPMKNALEMPGPFTVKDCDNKDVTLPGTSNFFPGTSCKELQPDVDCLTKHADLTECHEGPTPDHKHCVNPVCGRQKG
ncbi:MAG: hypothetical protein ACJ76N_23590 [Thermoanaerobaculia bacterium]